MDTVKLSLGPRIQLVLNKHQCESSREIHWIQEMESAPPSKGGHINLTLLGRKCF